MNRKLIPYGVSFELTARCNLDCRHCYHAYSSGHELDISGVRSVLAQLAGLGTLELTLTGGEPMMRPDFPDILHDAVKEYGFSIKIFSNLTLLTPDLADRMASLPLHSVETTLLGHTADLHDMLTGCPGAFEALMKSVHMLIDRGITVSAKTVLMKPNRHALDDMYVLMNGIGVSFRHDDTLFVGSDGGRGPLALQISDNDIRRARGVSGMPDDPPGTCNAGRSVMSIASDGTVFPCGAFPVPAGNVTEMPLRDIWYDSPVMRSVRTFRVEDYDVCPSCRYYLRCNGCIAMGMGLAKGRIYPCRLERKRLRSLQ